MKVLFDHASPFLLSHGGFQVQIQETKAGLENEGIQVEYLRWWDENQKGDLIHYFGLPSLSYLNQMQTKKVPLVCTHLLTGSCNRSDLLLAVQGALYRLMMAVPGWDLIKNQTTWPVIRNLPHLVVGLEAEKKVLTTAFALPPERINLIPLGLHEDFLAAKPAPDKQPWLITTGTITARKRSLELARLAKEARTPLLFVGKPYSEKDPYWKKFQAELDGRYVLHQSHVDNRVDMIGLLTQARGFALLSQHENWCLSAHEATACGLPLLVQDQKWSKERFGPEAHYWPPKPGPDHTRILREFYDLCPSLSKPAIKLYSWTEVAQQLKSIYETVLLKYR